MITPNTTLRTHEIADKLGITTRAVRSHVKSILKARICHPDYSAGGTLHNLDILPQLYDLDWLIAIAYRVATPESHRFREQLLTNISTPPFIIPLYK